MNSNSTNLPRVYRTLAVAGLLVVISSVFQTGCKKEISAGTEQAPDGIVVTEAGDNDLNMKGGATASAAPTGPATIAVYPVRSQHNTGYDSATDCAPSSWNCSDTYSNSDFIGSGSNAHYGIDIWGEFNAPIVAPVTGVVTFKGYDNGLGNTVVIRESSGWHHWLGHMNSISSQVPAVGSTITAGTLIGNLGHTGSNSGSVNHLHYSVNHGSGYWSTGQNFWGILNAKETATCGPSTVPAQSLAEGKYKILNVLSGKAVAVKGAVTTDGAEIEQHPYTDTNDNDEWNVIKLSNGYYRIVNVKSGKDLVISSASYLPSALAVQYSYANNGNYNDEWYLISNGSNWRIMSRNSLLGLNVQGASTADGANIIQYPYTNVAQSQFTFTVVP